MIYAVVGPTCVGKTKFSTLLAKKINAEIVNCDSMQIYKEISIGTAKVTDDEKDGIVHHLFDIVSIYDDFSVFDYQKMAREVISDILSRGKNVVVVGGTGLYLKALLYNYTFDKNGDSSKKLYDFKIIGLTKDREILYSDIDKRVDIMIDNGLVSEAKAFYDKHIYSRALSFAIGYKELFDYFDGSISLNDAIENIKKNSRHYAKRQYTFFNNQFDNIKWYDVMRIKMENIIKDII